MGTGLGLQVWELGEGGRGWMRKTVLRRGRRCCRRRHRRPRGGRRPPQSGPASRQIFGTKLFRRPRSVEKFDSPPAPAGAAQRCGDWPLRSAVQRSWLGKDVSYSLAGATVSRPARSTPDLPRNFEPRADSRDTCTFGFPKRSICRAWENLTPCPEKALERAGSGTARDTTPVQGRCLAARLRALARRPGRERPGLSGK